MLSFLSFFPPVVKEVIFLLGLNLLEAARDAIVIDPSLTCSAYLCSREILPNKTLDKVSLFFLDF